MFYPPFLLGHTVSFDDCKVESFDNTTKWSKKALYSGADWEAMCSEFDLFDGAMEVKSPSGRFTFKRKLLPKFTSLKTFMSAGVGRVAFDCDTHIPGLWEGNRHDPWMSITPSEVLSLRPGTKRAKGNVVVAGLGLGWQTIEIAKRKQVKSIRVVERSQELIDWIGPKVQEIAKREITFICEDARTFIPTMTADSAIIDIYPGYGGNKFPPCRNIPSVWVWGSGYPKGY